MVSIFTNDVAYSKFKLPQLLLLLLLLQYYYYYY